jgi:hypothetical protein
MKRAAVLTVLSLGLLASGFDVSVASAAPRVEVAPARAKDDPGDKKVKKLPMGKGGVLPKTLQLAPRGLEWGLGVRAIDRLYDKVFEHEFLALYKKTPVGGPRERALDIELKDKKEQLMRSLLKFEDIPTGIDYTPLKGEYSYQNGESLAYVTLRDGTKRHFFFFNDKLWKIYDEHKLRRGSSLGTSYDEAVKILSKKLRTQPTKVPQDFEKGQTYAEAVWKDDNKYVRALNREGEGIIALVYVEKEVQDNLARYRKNRPKNPHEMDRAVESALRKAEPPPGPKDEKAGKKR